MQVGDIVKCVYPGFANGPDCVVGNVFKINAIVDEYNMQGSLTGGKALIFDCHPYVYKHWLLVSASAFRFRLINEQDDSVLVSTKEIVV